MRGRRFAALSLLACLLAVRADACQVPVFRYALEQWPTDALELVVFHKGPLHPVEQRQIKFLIDEGMEGKALANFDVRAVDVSKPLPKELEPTWQEHQALRLPLVVLRFHGSGPKEPAAWVGPLNEEALGPLLKSPLRTEVTRRALAGAAVVWVLLESGDAQQDRDAQQLLATELAKLERTVELPEIDAEDRRYLRSAVPLKISFPLLRLRRDDPAESALVRMLLSIDGAAAKSGKPIAYPLFGRGRALDAYWGKDLTAESIASVVNFLCGPCSCQVKRQNPGYDLLFYFDWQEALLQTLINRGDAETAVAEARRAAAARAAVGENAEPLPSIPSPDLVKTDAQKSTADSAENPARADSAQETSSLAMADRTAPRPLESRHAAARSVTSASATEVIHEPRVRPLWFGLGVAAAGLAAVVGLVAAVSSLAKAR